MSVTERSTLGTFSASWIQENFSRTTTVEKRELNVDDDEKMERLLVGCSDGMLNARVYGNVSSIEKLSLGDEGVVNTVEGRPISRPDGVIVTRMKQGVLSGCVAFGLEDVQVRISGELVGRALPVEQREVDDVVVLFAVSGATITFRHCSVFRHVVVDKCRT